MASQDLIEDTPLGPIDWTMVATWSLIFIIGGVLTAIAIREIGLGK